MLQTSIQTSIQDKLFALKDDKYGDFQAKLMPTVAREAIIGVRTPQLRALAKELWEYNSALCEAFLTTLPHRTSTKTSCTPSFLRTFATTKPAFNVWRPSFHTWTTGPRATNLAPRSSRSTRPMSLNTSNPGSHPNMSTHAGLESRCS